MALTRRKFLEDIAVLGMGALIPPTLAIRNRFDFLRDSEDLPMRVPNEIRNNCVQIGPVYDIDLDCDDLRKKMMPIISEEAKKDGIIEFSFEVNKSLFGVATSSRLAGEVQDYARSAHEFLNSSIRGIEPLTFAWELLKGFEDFSRTYQNKAIIGKGFYAIYSFAVTDGKQHSLYDFVIPRRDSHFSYDALNHGSLPHIILSAGPSALCTSFTGLLGLTTYKNFRKYGSVRGLCEAAKADDVFTMPASQMMAEKHVQELCVPDGLTYVRKYWTGLEEHPLYNQFTQSMQWIKRHGLQNSFDLYMESPAKYLAAIASV
jgi:hypothetical protein